MASTIKKCRVCGREYEACHTLSQTPGVFRWQDVSCSQECGAIYLAKINLSRGNNNDEKPTNTTTPIIKEESHSYQNFVPFCVDASFEPELESITETAVNEFDEEDEYDEYDEFFEEDDDEEII